jgi:hypothetical protein
MSAHCLDCGADLVYTENYPAMDCPVCRRRDERDSIQRLFNRLDAAVSHHKRDQGDTAFCSDADERLYAARERILKDSARRG